MKRFSMFALVALVVVAAVLIVVGQSFGDGANNQVPYIVDRNSSRTILLEEFDPSSVQPDSDLYIQYPDGNTAEVNYFAISDGTEVYVSHSGLDWWLDYAQVPYDSSYLTDVLGIILEDGKVLEFQPYDVDGIAWFKLDEIKEALHAEGVCYVVL